MVPFVALYNNLKLRVADYSLPTIIFNKIKDIYSTIVFIIPETAVLSDFRIFLSELIISDRLAKIIFDENHTIAIDNI